MNLQDVSKSLGELREGLARIRKELAEHFTDVEQNDRYGQQMWSFVGKAAVQLEDVVDVVNHAESTFLEVVNYYGEDEKSLNSAEFYGIFKTFVTSYRVCVSHSETLVTIHSYRLPEMQDGQSIHCTGARSHRKTEERHGRIKSSAGTRICHNREFRRHCCLG